MEPIIASDGTIAVRTLHSALLYYITENCIFRVSRVTPHEQVEQWVFVVLWHMYSVFLLHSNLCTDSKYLFHSTGYYCCIGKRIM